MMLPTSRTAQVVAQTGLDVSFLLCKGEKFTEGPGSDY
jgi:hypothetical protein